ncbi:MAG: phosphoribosylanthranilate isomerase [Acidobacteria bacterium]|nr:phosphoribosylanthranilate isomerase [Acidobacteriota bacterium]
MFRVKICGLVHRADALAAAASGADAVGCLVGVRHRAEDAVSAKEAHSILDRLPRSVHRVIVTHLARADEVSSLVFQTGCSCLQLHADIPVEEIRAVREKFPSVLIIKALSVEGRMNDADRNRLCGEGNRYLNDVDAFVLDSKNVEEDRVGGTGRVHDWAASRDIISHLGKPIILAGGLNPKNVAQAVDTVRPYGVDVNTGVEASGKRGDGRKDGARLRLFIQNARRALDRVHGCRQ